jgi:hypothetical protein
MKQPNKELADEYPEGPDPLDRLIDYVFTTAYWAFDCGATKETLLSQIEEAFDCVQKKKEGGTTL